MTAVTLDQVPEVNALPWVFDDGGRAEAGFRGFTRDCACRAIAIGTGRPYLEVYDLIIEAARRERRKRPSHPRTGIYKPTMHRVMEGLGWTWTPTMSIGSGTTVHLREGELPTTGRHVISVSRHYVALVDGVLHDTHDPSRDGFRAVYGYYSGVSD